MSMGRFHHTKNTVEASLWCDSCGKHTMHRIDTGRKGPCLSPTHGRQRKLIDTAPAAAEQPSLFGDMRSQKDRG
jgi:ribosomal protein L44E